MNILLTGFEKFGKEKMNPSWDAIKDLDGAVISNVRIFCRQLPVSFKRALTIVKELLGSIRPRFYIAFGLAGGRNTVTVERVAINIMDSTKPDNDNYTPKDETIFEDGPAAYFATVPIKDIIKVLREKGIPAIISNSAGTYVCNTVFYSGLYYANKLGLETKVGFIHLPYDTSQVLDKDKPSLPLNLIKEGIIELINFLAQTKNKERC
ncbi:MAG: pyroglutamyl-peptidase I [Candidatus Odinarchaeota archaeon]|nr:pyroglutamyl-peptidase I [Candidatus Odinarchaeota archaeon]